MNSKAIISKYTHREVAHDDLVSLCQFPMDETELFFMYPKATYPLTTDQLKSSVESRFDSTVILFDGNIAGFANFYEVVENQYCTIGNVIVNPVFRGKGVGTYLIDVMEKKAVSNYRVIEIHLSCFNQNIAGLLLYQKLGYVPYEIEKRVDKKSLTVATIKMKKIVKKSELSGTEFGSLIES